MRVKWFWVVGRKTVFGFPIEKEVGFDKQTTQVAEALKEEREA